jgi:hypothetical protein
MVLPATTFPRFAKPPGSADRYLCDSCGRIITKHFWLGRAHVETPLGPEKYTCVRGETYLTGFKEWDHLGKRERRKRVSATVFLGFFISVLCLIFVGGPVFLLLWELASTPTAFITAVVLALLPFVIIHSTFWHAVVASVWRTRIRTSQG